MPPRCSGCPFRDRPLLTSDVLFLRLSRLTANWRSQQRLLFGLISLKYLLIPIYLKQSMHWSVFFLILCTILKCMYCSVMLTIIFMLYSISRTFASYTPETLHLLTNTFFFLPPCSPWQPNYLSFFFSNLAAPGLSCGLQGLQCSLQHTGSLVPWPGIQPSIGSLESWPRDHQRSPGNHHSTFSFLFCDYLRYLM